MFSFMLKMAEGKLVEFDTALSRKSVGVIKPQLKPREQDSLEVSVSPGTEWECCSALPSDSS